MTIFRRSLQRYTANGDLDAEFPFEAITAEADSATGGAWVITREETIRLDPKGKIQLRVKHKSSTSQAWAAELG